MQKLSGKIFKGLIYSFFVLVFVWVSAHLFFEKQTDAFLASVTDFLYQRGVEVVEIPHLKIIYPDDLQSLEPTLTDPVVRQRLNNIYEPLVRPDRDLTMRPALALSWGLLDSTTWDFILRPNVVFHNGSSFSAEDVVSSLNRAISHENSQLVGLLSSIKEIEVVDNLRIRIKTHRPDPLLLQRLASVLIFPSEYENEDDFAPVGTGAYKFSEWERGDRIILNRFDKYWGASAKFERVSMFSRVNKNERVMMFLNGDAHFLAFVPFDAVDVLEERGFEIVGIPSLEVQFLIFNMESSVLDSAEKREVVRLAVDRAEFAEILGAHAHVVGQFVSNGVFGFNPDIEHVEADIEKAGILAEELGLKGRTVTLHLPKGLTVLGEHVRTKLNSIDINVLVSYLEPADFFESIVAGEADIYFMGFRASRGDSADFLDVVVHTDAEFNVAKYSNEEVDLLIENSFTEMDPALRIADLQEVMRIIVEEDVLGIPLFEYDTLYSFVRDIEFKPRIDGFIYFDDLKIK